MKANYAQPNIIPFKLSLWPEFPKVSLLLENLSHPEYGGNKYWKLLKNVEAFRNTDKKGILSFGGAYSNHVYALSALCRELKIPLKLMIRGDELDANNATLSFALKNGAKLEFVSRATYRSWRENSFIEVGNLHPDFFLIPEGGSNNEGVLGCADWAKIIPDKFELICLPVGSGGSLAGLAMGLENRARVLGFSALKGSFLKKDIEQLQHRSFGRISDNWNLTNAYHFGGYAKLTKPLMEFIRSCYQQTGILADPIYTSKMLFGLNELMLKNELGLYSEILLIHTGGLQAWSGFKSLPFEIRS